MAPSRLPPVLALEIPLPWRPAADRRGPARADPADSVDNPLWGAPRIHGELLKLGFEVAQSSVAKYMVKRCGPPSPGWRTFLRNHAPDIAAMDLCWAEAPRYLIRDRDRVYGAAVTHRLRAMGIRDKPIAPGSPWQNGFAEKLIGSNSSRVCRPYCRLGRSALTPDPDEVCRLL